MLKRVRRLFRRVVPRLEDPVLDAPLLMNAHERELETSYSSMIDDAPADLFRRNRFAEGLRWAAVLRTLGINGERGWVMDIGAGDGAIELALNVRGIRTVSVEPLWNIAFSDLRAVVRSPLHRVIARAEHLPFKESVFRAAVCLETLEHLTAPADAASEIGRTLEPKALLLLTTPPRLRYIFRPDPHFGIRSLVVFPPAVQRRIARGRGFDQPHNHVDRIYTSVVEVANVFVRFRLHTVLSRSRAPKRWFWDALVFERDQVPSRPSTGVLS